jgi:nicotinamidase-related amidase
MTQGAGGSSILEKDKERPTMTSLDDKTALIIIDVQDGLDDPRYGKRSNPDAESNMARLLAAWREKKRPIFHIQHMSTHPNSPLRPELPGNAIKRIVAPRVMNR